LNPIREHGQGHILISRVIGLKIESEIVHAAHVSVHHKLNRKCGGFTGFECHRTDDRSRRSTPLDDLDSWRLGKLKHLVANVLKLE